jgi:hypothetical protein
VGVSRRGIPSEDEEFLPSMTSFSLRISRVKERRAIDSGSKLPEELASVEVAIEAEQRK